MSLNRLRVTLDLDSGQFTVNMARAGQAVTNFSQQTNAGQRSIANIERSVTGFGSRLRDMIVSIGQARAALHNIWSVTGAWAKSILDANANLERMQFLLKGMSTATSEVGRMQEASTQLNQILTLSKNAPFTIEALTDAWVKFRSVGLDPSTGSLKALVDAVASFGGTDQILHRATVAIQQMAGKGVISMEELRQQLGEAVPSAMNLLAKGMGLTMSDLVKKISTGTVEARSALSKLFAEFQQNFGGASTEMMQTFSGQMSRLKTNWTLFYKEVGQGGNVFARSKELLIELNNALSPERSRVFAVALGESLRTILDALARTVKFIFEYREEIIDLAKAFGILFATVRIGVPVVSALVIAFRALNISGIAAIVARLASRFGVLTAAMGAATLGARGLWGALMALFASNPVGWILGAVAAVGAITYAWFKYGDSVKRATANLKEHEGVETQRDINAAQKALETNIERREKLLRGLDTINQRLAKNPGLIEQLNTRKEINARLTALNQEIADQEKQLAIARRNRRDAEMSTEEQRLLLHLQQQVNETRAAYAMDEREYQKLLDSKGVKDKEAAERLQAYRTRLRELEIADVEKLFNAQIEAQEKLRDAALKGNNVPEAGARQRLVDRLKEAAEQFKQQAEAANDALNSVNVYIDNPNSKPQAEHPAITAIENLKEKIVGLRAELQGAAKESEILQQKILDGDYTSKTGTPPTPEQIRELKELTTEYERLKKAVTEFKERQKSTEEAMEAVTRAAAQAGQELQNANDKFDFGSVDGAETRLRSFLRTMAGIRATAVMTAEDLKKFDEMVNRTAATLSEAAGKNKYLELLESNRQLQLDLLTNTRERLDAEISLERRALQSWIEINIEKTEAGKQQAQEILAEFEQNAELRRRLLEAEQPIARLLANWKDTTTAMQEASAGWIDDFVNRLVTGIDSGKIAWGDFVRQVIKDILLMQLRAQAANLFGSILPALRSNAPGTQFGGSTTGNPTATFAANGAVVGPSGPMVLNKYRNGGIARRPQVAVFGEGDTPEAYVPLPDGRTIPVTLQGGISQSVPNIQVNVINESGTEVDAQSGNVKFDGSNYVLDVVLSAVSRPGQFRDGLRGAMR